MSDERELAHASDGAGAPDTTPPPEGDFGRLAQAVVDASAATTWKEAVLEWQVSGCAEDGDAEGVCVCGHRHLRYLFEIWNPVTQRTLFPIGSVCIRRFDRADLVRETAVLRQLMRLAGEAVRLGSGGVVGIKDGLVSRALIDRMHDQGAFGDDAQGQRDFERLRRLFGARRLDDGARREAASIVSRRVNPYLFDFWGRTRAGGYGAEPPRSRA